MSIRKNEHDFVCEPHSIKILARNSKVNRQLEVEVQVDDKPALFGVYAIREYTLEETIEKVKVFCNGVQMFTEDEIQDWIDEDRIMRALYVYRLLKKVWTRGGKLIWEKN